jgi:hypothetical protein
MSTEHSRHYPGRATSSPTNKEQNKMNNGQITIVTIELLLKEAQRINLFNNNMQVIISECVPPTIESLRDSQQLPGLTFIGVHVNGEHLISVTKGNEREALALLHKVENIIIKIPEAKRQKKKGN